MIIVTQEVIDKKINIDYDAIANIKDIKKLKKRLSEVDLNEEIKIYDMGIVTSRSNKTCEVKDHINKTSVGPHTDKIEYIINGKSVKTMASQGEKNMFFSILKKAESNIIKKETNKEPIVLLDDIFSKLDKKNTDLILEIFKNNSQTIITHTEEINNKNINQIMING